MSQPYLTVCFWNVAKNDACMEVLSEIVVEHRVDVVVLAESPITSAGLALSLTAATRSSFNSDVLPEAGRMVWAFRTGLSVTPVFDGDKVSIREIQPALGLPVLVCGIHASSGMHLDRDDLNILIQRAARDVESAEVRRQHDRTIVCGDFNLSPFDQGIVSSDHFHAVMSRKLASGVQRVVLGETKKFFYNPMWALLAEDDDVCGTYFRRSSSPLEQFWYCLDQILFRPSLLANLSAKPVSILKRVGARSLIQANGKPHPSDHLPLMAQLVL